ncbi:transcriptional regulator AsnC [Lactiplantibacillus plantarum]|nr:transcriptional regulator AsnC [Lactiplantibacillus plantarum]
MNWFLTLDQADQEFVKQLVYASGSLKQLAKIYQVSYPTVRARLNNVINKITLLEDKKKDSFETKLMQLVIDEKVSLDVAKDLIKDYQEAKNE